MQVLLTRAAFIADLAASRLIESPLPAGSPFLLRMGNLTLQTSPSSLLAVFTVIFYRACPASTAV